MLLETAIQKTKLTKWIGFIVKLSITLGVMGIALTKVFDQCSLSTLVGYWGCFFTWKSGFGLGLLLLSFWNWGTESRKWQLILPTKISFLEAFKSVLIGLGVSVFMPRVAGESIGRYTSHSGNKKEVVSGLLLSKVLQTSVTFFMGLIGFVYFFDEVNELILFEIQLLIPVLLVLGVGGLLYLKKDLLLEYFTPFYELNILQLGRLYFWTVLRYTSFVGQVVFVVLLLDIDVDFTELVLGLMLMYGTRLVTVSFNVAVDLAIRFSTAILVLQKLGVMSNVNDVIAVFTLIWIINIIVPTVIGGILISTRR